MTECEAYVAFNLTDRIGSAKVASLEREFGSVAAAWESDPSRTSRSGGAVDWKGEFAKAARFGVRIVTPADEDYPASLRNAPGHPLALYVKGDASALSMPAIAMVGTRRATTYGLDQAFRFSRDLAESGWCIISGLALGIDAESHKGALAAGGKTVGVIGSGLDMFYPEQNRELAREIVKSGGAVVSEFPFGRPPDEQTFPQRNHVVAALASGVIAVECPSKSGTLITTGIAADMGRTVMAVPGRVDSRSSAGCLALIRDGAVLVRNARDVAEAMSELFPKKPAANGAARHFATGAAEPGRSRGGAEPALSPPPKFSVEESIVMRYVDAEGIAVDDLVRLTKLPAAKVNSICMTLRVKGRLRFFPGNRVALPREG